MFLSNFHFKTSCLYTMFQQFSLILIILTLATWTCSYFVVTLYTRTLFCSFIIIFKLKIIFSFKKYTIVCVCECVVIHVCVTSWLLAVPILLPAFCVFFFHNVYCSRNCRSEKTLIPTFFTFLRFEYQTYKIQS